ncbi:MAG: mechanosensitive ion channel, partial [Thiothrix sp.]|nr:mechanosensitive ion channel [Thiothrix sp.]
TAEGYVKDISIRSTTIETFDRADIIVPNSELIAGQVTNMMLHNQYGRIIIPVRIAYGSDTEKIITLLRKVGENHPLTLKEHGKQQVQALFRSFGDSAMLFELRCHIRDVEATIQVISELNLAIDKAFRAAGITIPYPQQTVHVATLPGTGSQAAEPPIPAPPPTTTTATTAPGSAGSSYSV